MSPFVITSCRLWYTYSKQFLPEAAMRMKSRMVRVSSKGQIVLPKGVRDRAGIVEGDYIVVQELEDGVLLLGKPSSGPMDAITAELRQEAESTGFRRKDLERAIKSIRSGAQ